VDTTIPYKFQLLEKYWKTTKSKYVDRERERERRGGGWREIEGEGGKDIYQHLHKVFFSWTCPSPLNF
jgi:hypothetical protein